MVALFAVNLGRMSEHYDAIIVGAGQAGPALAGRLTGAGMRVALVERQLFGGTCVNTGCTPTKTLIASARIAWQARTARDYGIDAGEVAVDWARVRARKDEVVQQSRGGLEQWLRGMHGLTVIQAHARFEAPDRLRAGARRLSAARIFLNVGGRAHVPDFPGVDEVPYLTNGSLLDIDAIPEHLIVVGGSYIGLEFAQMFRRLGARVTVIEKSSRLIGREDADISASIQEFLEAEGIEFRLHAECIHLRSAQARVVVGVDCRSGAPVVDGSHVLLAVGRRPNTDDLDLDTAGIRTDAAGYIVVDDELRTSVPGIWALGDCNGRGAFTHTAYNDHQIVADNLLAGRSRRVSDRIACYALYVDPPLGRVGLTEAQARAEGRRLRIAVRPMTRVSRAVEKGETRGFMKVMVDADSEQIVGAALLGVGADESVHCILDVMSAGVRYQVLRDTMHIHPTVSELVPTLLGELPQVAGATGPRAARS